MFEFDFCPWDKLTPDNYALCEESACAWVRQPGNTISNFVFFIIGLLLLRQYDLQKKSYDFGFALCTIFIGLCSTIAHATVTQIGGLLDYASIFSMFSLIVTFHAYPKFELKLRVIRLFLITFATTLVLLFVFSELKAYIFVVFVLILLLLELRYLKQNCYSHKTLNKIFVVLVIGGTAFTLDSMRIICYPQIHYLQLHMLWHISMALNIIFFADHFRQTRAKLYL